MEEIINRYLENIERYLKPLPVSERVDILKEIKSEVSELQNAGKTNEEIIERLGNPKVLAKAYLGSLISEGKTFRFVKVPAMIAYYSLASLSGIIVIPTLVICAPVFMICGAICPVLGVIKALNSLLNLKIPYADNIVVAGIQSPFAALALCILTGLGLFLAGYGCWKLLISYFRAVSKTKDFLSI